MDKIYVVYWTGGGNTLEMANAIGDGIKEGGAEAEIVEVSSVTVDALKDAKNSAEVLEESEMEPFVADFEGVASGKNLLLFGSYGWGDGEWMRDWVDRMKNAGANIVGGEGLICHEAPDDEAKAECISFGKQLASA